jgi:hypothetical protein
MAGAMRLVFLTLILANVFFFAWSSHYGADKRPKNGNAPLEQLEPDKLKIVPPPSSALASGGCLEWGSFTLTEYPRAEKALEPLGLGNRLSTRRTEEVAGWWVYLPPQGSRQEALRRASELKALGIGDYFIVAEEGEWRWSLSLGIYRTEEAAQARLAGLQAQGLASALVAARDTVVPKLWLQVKGVDASLEARLKEIARQMQGSELRGCS